MSLSLKVELSASIFMYKINQHYRMNMYIYM